MGLLQRVSEITARAFIKLGLWRNRDIHQIFRFWGWLAVSVWLLKALALSLLAYWSN